MVSLSLSHFHFIFKQDGVPLWFQGTRMCPRWKGKADPPCCSNPRGVHVSNVIPSVLLEVVKARAELVQDTTRICFSRILKKKKTYDRVMRDMAAGCRCTEADLANQLLKPWVLLVMTSSGISIFSAEMGPFCRRLAWRLKWSILLNIFTQVALYARRRPPIGSNVDC